MITAIRTFNGATSSIMNLPKLQVGSASTYTERLNFIGVNIYDGEYMTLDQSNASLVIALKYWSKLELDIEYTFDTDSSCNRRIKQVINILLTDADVTNTNYAYFDVYSGTSTASVFIYPFMHESREYLSLESKQTGAVCRYDWMQRGLLLLN